MKSDASFDRRHFMAGIASLAALSGNARAAEAWNFRGIYPIAWTPCTPDGALDLSAMAAQVAFCRRGQVAGLVWPQNASAWATLSEQEWTNGMRALLSAAKGGKTRIVIGVQTVGGDTEKSIRYQTRGGARCRRHHLAASGECNAGSGGCLLSGNRRCHTPAPDDAGCRQCQRGPGY